MKIVCLSDTHWHRPPHLPVGDLIIHAGDGTEWEGFDDWVRRNNVWCVSGNHDSDELELDDTEVVVNGLRIYGMPWTPCYGNWWHMLDRNSDELRAKVEAIPDGLDVLVTHGPPFGRLDTWNGQTRIGCELLAAHLANLSHPPRLHVFGHIHEGHGVVDLRDLGGTCYVNAAICDKDYDPVNRIITINL